MYFVYLMGSLSVVLGPSALLGFLDLTIFTPATETGDATQQFLFYQGLQVILMLFTFGLCYIFGTPMFVVHNLDR